MKKIELLAPAGSLEKLKVAFHYGADACYIGGRDFSLRANATNFSVDEIKEACDIAHELGKKIYVTVNIVFHNEDVKGLEEYLRSLEEAGVDAIIMSDPWLISFVKEKKINLELHMSTQASTLNYESVNFWKDLGVSRVVLARELHYTEIKDIIDKTGMEIETFVHGAMCSSYSGRCVLSNYFTNRDANRGGCAQVCRYCFDLYDDNKEKVESDTEFTMSTKDLSLISMLSKMIEIGIASLKIEGRMRSNYYIATVVSTYREAIDSYYDGTLDEEKLAYYKKILNRVANRDSEEQFFNTFPDVKGQYFLGRQEVSNQDFLGIVLDYDEENKIVTITERNFFKKGDVVEIFGPKTKTFTFTVPDIYNEDGELVDAARHPEEIIRFKLDVLVRKDDIMRIKI